jgi:hypothetical protein
MADHGVSGGAQTVVGPGLMLAAGVQHPATFMVPADTAAYKAWTVSPVHAHLH